MTDLISIPVDQWGVTLAVNPQRISELGGQMIAFDEIVARIRNYDEPYYLNDEGLAIWSQYTTSLDFGHEYEGGGYVISVGYEADTWNGSADIIAEVCIEWFDDYAAEAGMVERRDEDYCLRLGLEVLQEYIMQND